MKIFNSKILNYMLCGFLLVLAFYLLHRNVTYHSLLEGMRNDKPFDEVVEEVGSKNKVMEDQLLIDKHRTHHENLITHLEESANMHMLELYKEGIVPHIQVHDELDISVINDLEAAKIKDIMENAVDLEIPNKVDYESGPNWGEIK